MKQNFTGISLPPNTPLPQDQQWQVKDFSKGLVLADAPEDIVEGAASHMEDCEITRDDRLIRAPGVAQAESLITHVPSQMILHPGPAFKSELLFLSAPYLGVKSSAATQWTNVGLSGTPRYSFTNYAGILIGSNGVGGTYSRKFGESTITKIAGAPSAQALAVFANRLVLGATDINGSRDLMGVAWSGTLDYADWGQTDDSEGSADQVLIGAMRQADRIQSFAPLGFDTLAVINRRSIWIGNPTGDIWQPIRFAPRMEGTGCIAPETVQPTEFGVLFLSDDGVRLFTGNDAPVISDAINDDLIIDESQIYTSAFDPGRKRYYLLTPVCTYVLDMLRRRWFKWNSVFAGAVFFPTQGAPGLTWGQAVGSWGSQTLAWWQMGGGTETGGKMFFLSTGTLGNLGVEDPTINTVYGNPLSPAWFDRKGVGDAQETLMTSQGVWLTYEADTHADVEIWLPDKPNGDYEAVVTGALNPGATIKQSKIAHIPFIHTGRGIGFGLKITSGSPRIRRAQTTFQETSRLVEFAQISPTGVGVTLPLMTFSASGTVQTPAISVPVLDSYSYMSFVATDGNQSDGYIGANPQNYGRVVGPPYNLYPDIPSLPANNANGRHRAFFLLNKGQTGGSSAGRTFRFASLGSLSEIGFSCVLNLSGNTRASTLALFKFFSSNLQIPVYSAVTANELNFEITTDNKIQFSRYDTGGPVVFGPTAALPSTGFIRLDFRFKAHPTAGSIKIVRTDVTPNVTLLDLSGINTTKNGGTFNFPLCYGGLSVVPLSSPDLSADLTLVHDLVFYDVSTLATGQTFGLIKCGTLQVAGNGDTIQSTSAGGFYGSPLLPDRWKNLVYGNIEGFTECAVPHGDEGNAQVSFNGNNLTDYYFLDPPDAGATEILAVIPYFYAVRTGSSISKNTAQILLKSSGVVAASSILEADNGGYRYQGALSRPEGGFTQLPKFVIRNDPATGVPFTPTGLANAQLGWHQLVTQGGTGNQLTLFGVEYIWR